MSTKTNKPKLALDAVIKNELEKLPSILDEMDAKDRCNFLIKMMQYNDIQKSKYSPFTINSLG